MRLIDADVLTEGRVDNDPVVIAAMCAPTVNAVPVVRCMECAHSYDSVSGRYCSCGPCVDCFVPDSFFCSYGERRESDEQAP